jgi:hypothetical protein
MRKLKLINLRLFQYIFHLINLNQMKVNKGYLIIP